MTNSYKEITNPIWLAKRWPRNIIHSAFTPNLR